MESQFDYEPPTARHPRHRESRTTKIAYEFGAILLALTVLAAVIFLGYHFLAFLVRLVGGAL